MTMVDNTRTSARDLRRLRIALLIGGAIMAGFVFEDLYYLPDVIVNDYLINRFGLQLPLVLSAFLLTFYRGFDAIRDPLFTGLMLLETWINFAFIYIAWDKAQFMFPYEGTLLYAFYCIFILDIRFRWALSASAINALLFFLLISFQSMYGDRGLFAAGFVASSLLIASYAKYRLDASLALIHQANQKLVHLSRHDELTSILNRRALEEESALLMSVCQREALPIAVLMVDIDEFKKYNDHFGHQQGDQVIRQQALILKQVFKRTGDIVGRYGGEEFLVVVSGLSEQQLAACCEAVHKKWQDSAIAHADAASDTMVNCSIGGVLAMPSQGSDIDGLVKQADDNLYRIKKTGRGATELTTLAE